MFQKRNEEHIRHWTSCFVISLLVLCYTPLFAGEPGGGDSPQDVFKAAQAAGAKKDFGTLAKLTAPSEQPMLAFGTDMAVGMFVEFYEGQKADELKKKYQAIQTKYSIKTGTEEDDEKLHVTEDTPQEVIDEHMRKRAKKLYGQIDAEKYVPDLMNILISMPEMAEQAFFPAEELSGLKVDGDKATGQAGEKKISFIRENGRWYLTADVMN